MGYSEVKGEIMPYKVITENGSINVLEQIGERKNRETGNLEPIYRSNGWNQNDVIPDEKVAPIVQKQYEDGDEHIRSLIEQVEDKKSKKPVKKADAE
jgi:hypothetical protein